MSSIFNQTDEPEVTPTASETPSLLPVSFKWGLITALAGAGFSILVFLLDKQFEKWVQWLSLILLVLGIVFAAREHRDYDLAGKISYGRALGVGVTVALFAWVFGSLYMLVYINFIDLDFTEQLLLNAEQQMIEQGYEDDVIEVGMEWTKKVMSPIGLVLAGLFNNLFWGILSSLIASLFIKKS